MRLSDPLDADFVLLITNEAPFIDPLIVTFAVYKKVKHVKPFDSVEVK